jgi:hypothetical protein
LKSTDSRDAPAPPAGALAPLAEAWAPPAEALVPPAEALVPPDEAPVPRDESPVPSVEVARGEFPAFPDPAGPKAGRLGADRRQSLRDPIGVVTR